MARWVRNWTKGLSDAHRERILTIEYGGMNAVLYDLSEVTGKEEYRDLAHWFDQRAFFDPLAARRDELTGLHANTQFPKVIGAARRYELTGEPRYRDIAEYFWREVTGLRSYATGGTSDGERWETAPGVLSTALSASSAECCCAYNMLKLTRHVFAWTADPRAADYFERTCWNHRLGTQNPEDGTLMYYYPLASGYWKFYGAPLSAFWCCTGTGVEEFAKAGDSIYFHDDAGIFVNLFIASEVRWPEKGLRLVQETSFPDEEKTTLRIEAERPVEMTLRLRVPWWATRGGNGEGQRRRAPGLREPFELSDADADLEDRGPRRARAADEPLGRADAGRSNGPGRDVRPPRAGRTPRDAESHPRDAVRRIRLRAEGRSGAGRPDCGRPARRLELDRARCRQAPRVSDARAGEEPGARPRKPPLRRALRRVLEGPARAGLSVGESGSSDDRAIGRSGARMTIGSGSRLGPYEILSRLGAGGMGEVWRARDTRLERTVAIKILPPHLSSSPEVRQRFEREAKTISQLSHPHICALHDVGREGPIEYLVMEYLEGETLADRLAKGALPLEPMLRYGTQIAGALDKAHRQGIVHRDLKPGNIMLTRSGVKLLDFGLAKAVAPPGSPADLTSNPTAAARSELTQEGTLLGTLSYMAPEQLEGREADSRTDIFALGATLYEAATGRKAFSGSSRASLISSILRDEPKPPSRIEATSPPALDRIIGRCLAKDPEQRWQSAGDVALELEWLARGGADEPAAVPSLRGSSRSRWPIGLAIAGLLAAAIAAYVAVRRPTTPPRSPIRFAVRAPQGTRFPWIRMQNLFAVSPDGSRIVFVARSADGRDALWVRSLADPAAVMVTGTEGAAAPFWSPDGQWIAFFADGKLKKVGQSGGAPESLCEVSPGYPSGSWGSQHSILFAALTDTAVKLVAEGGGTPRPTVKIDPGRKEVGVAYPDFLPDGRHFLYVARSEAEGQAYVRLGSVEDATSAPILSNSSRAQYVPAGPGAAAGGASGYLLFARNGTLFAQRFDAGSRRLVGDPISTDQDVWQHVLIGSGPFSASDNGVLGSRGNSGPSRLVWVDRAGRETASLESPGGYTSVRLSPDGRKVAVSRVDPRTGLHDLLVGELSRQVLTRLELGPNDNLPPAWSPDGARLAFSVGSMRHPPALYWVSLRSPRPPEPILPPTGQAQRVEDWSADGRYLLSGGFVGPSAGHWIVDLAGDRKLRPLVMGNFVLNEAEAQFSPDGRWAAFCLIEAGRSEVYLVRFPEPGERIRVSPNGGLRPRWRRDGQELFYVSADGQMMATPVRLGSDAQIGAPQRLFQTSPEGWSDFDVTADGSRFLAVARGPAPDAEAIAVTVNWFALLKR